MAQVAHMAEKTIKPCPFCGSAADFERYRHLATGPGVAVKCKGCSAMVFRRSCNGGLEAALAAWNWRQHEPS